MGSRGALEELGRAVQAALSEPSGVAATQVVFPSNGEGYRAVIVRVENVSYFTRLGLPYFGDIAGGTTPEGKVRMLLPDELLEAVRHASQAADERTG